MAGTQAGTQASQGEQAAAPLPAVAVAPAAAAPAVGATTPSFSSMFSPEDFADFSVEGGAWEGDDFAQWGTTEAPARDVDSVSVGKVNFFDAKDELEPELERWRGRATGLEARLKGATDMRRRWGLREQELLEHIDMLSRQLGGQGSELEQWQAELSTLWNNTLNWFAPRE